MRWCLGIFWINSFLYHLTVYSTAPLPAGICQVVGCDVLLSGVGKAVLFVSAGAALFFYLRNKVMSVACLSLGVLSMLSFTIEESNGILSRGGMFTALFFAQGMAFSISHGDKASVKAILYSVQIVIAAYWLASISKLETSGLQWVEDAKYIPLQVVKSFSTEYFTIGDEYPLVQGKAIVSDLMDRTELIQLVLLFALLVEFTSPLAIFGRRWAIVIGTLLLLMHIGIEWVMNIYIDVIGHPMVIVLINPWYLFSHIISKPFRKNQAFKRLTLIR